MITYTIIMSWVSLRQKSSIMIEGGSTDWTLQTHAYLIECNALHTYMVNREVLNMT